MGPMFQAPEHHNISECKRSEGLCFKPPVVLPADALGVEEWLRGRISMLLVEM